MNFLVPGKMQVLHCNEGSSFDGIRDHGQAPQIDVPGGGKMYQSDPAYHVLFDEGNFDFA
ncbi:MAG: hypothetical protein ACOX5R_05075 [bacterium]|jgi:hypothetical protein